MTQKRFDRLTRSARAEDGMALLIAVVVLLLMSALGLAALQHAGDEASGSGQARRKDATLYAADSGIKMIQVSLLNNVATSSANPVTLDQPTLIKDGFGNPIPIRSGAPQNGTMPATPEAVAPDPNQPSQPQQGFMVNQGSPNSSTFRPVRADVTALDVANGMVHLQAQFTVLDSTGGGGY
jgi:hypothetical protein